MAKKSPHKRKKKLHTTSKTIKTPSLEPIVVSKKDEEQYIVQERSWVLRLIFAFIIFAFLGGIWLIFAEQNSDTSSNNTVVESAVSSSAGINIEGGNLGQISNTGSPSNQEDTSLVNGSSESSVLTNGVGQSNQLQPTIDKCKYQQYNQPGQSNCSSQ